MARGFGAPHHRDRGAGFIGSNFVHWVVENQSGGARHGAGRAHLRRQS